MVALVVVAMLWGNCLSCPDARAAASSPTSSHSCCHKPHPASAKCQTEGLSHFVKADSVVPVVPVVVTVSDYSFAEAPIPLRAATPYPTLHSPPGNSFPITLRI
jgi:hypothetical protein